MQQMIGTHLPHLSQPQLTGLVLWVCGRYPGRERLPERRRVRPLALGQLEQPAPVSPGVSISGSGCTTAATGPVPARPSWT